VSEELLIEQPQGGVWLSPGKRVGHLVAIFNCSNKEMAYDDLSEKEKEKATFEFVDLDQERQLMLGYDNHPGVTFKLKVGNKAAVLGRIALEPSKKGNDAVVLGEHTDADAARLREWHKAYASGVRPTASAQAANQVPATTAPASAPVPQAAPVSAAPATAPAAPDVAALLGTMDAGTLALLMKAAQQNGGQ
jgi:hypothetical protein